MNRRRPKTSSQPLTSGEPNWFLALLLAPAVVGSVAAVMVLTNVSALGTTLARLAGRRSGRGTAARQVAAGDRSDGSLLGLRSAILGTGKQDITKVFGPPHSAAVIGAGDTWYYPLRSNRKLAMAISFDAGRAREVEFFHSPAMTNRHR